MYYQPHPTGIDKIVVHSTLAQHFFILSTVYSLPTIAVLPKDCALKTPESAPEVPALAEAFVILKPGIQPKGHHPSLKLKKKLGQRQRRGDRVTASLVRFHTRSGASSG